MNIKKILLFIAFVTTSLNAYNFEATLGIHDFMVRDIKTNNLPSHIKDGTSHTLGGNIGIVLRHQTKNGINIYAKAETFVDNDKDKLDNDHIPIWFDFVVDIDGIISKYNQNNEFKWYVYLDNRQNTVSCIEREVRQHLGVGWRYFNRNFEFALKGYLGFYYIEIDDDTPVSRGYNRMDLDNGEASNVLEAKIAYQITKDFNIMAKAKRYSANAGFKEMESDYEVRMRYENIDFLTDGASINFLVKYAKYNFDDFNEGHTLPILPWDNDTLIQTFVSFPVNF